ncbi:MAG: PA containing protein, partial [Pseudonocardiaceae bacterium]
DKGVHELLAGALESVTHRLDALSTRLDGLEEGVGGRIGSVTERLGVLDGALAHRPDVDSLFGLVRQANQESEMRYTAQLDEAMATFAEIIMGGGTPAPLPTTPPPPPRPAQRRVRARKVPEPGEEGVVIDAAS